MQITLYNTLSRELHPIQPRQDGTLTLYCCGPTVYGPAHIGNFRTFLIQDVFRRTIDLTGAKLKHVRNITDVDDKTIRQSQIEGKPLEEFTRHWTERFNADCAALNVLPPHNTPSAVAHIPEMIDFIDTLLRKGHAYQKDGSVYFRVDSFPSYGALSRLKEREITTHQPNLPDHEDNDEYARDSAADFVLWKRRKPEDGPNYWQSPWGEGRPGWHIECSTMACKHLGPSIDLHSGGIDLIFPHHENEIAQSEAATGLPFVKHWFHIAHLMVESRKMSKSLGNLYTLQDIQAMGHEAPTLRYVLISGHYRQPLNFFRETLSAAKSALEKLAQFQQWLEAQTPIPTPQFGALPLHHFQPVVDALLDDLNTPKALGELFTSIHRIKQQPMNQEELNACAFGWASVLYALGIQLPASQQLSAIPPEIKELAEERLAARNNKEWQKSDELRARLAALGWQIKDSKDSYQLSQTN